VRPGTEAPSRILIVLHGAIGDVIRALPLALRVRSGFPRAHVAWAVEPPAAPLLAGHPAIDERIVFRRDLGASAFLSFLREIRRRRFDLTLDLQRHLKSGIVSRASGAPRRIGFHRTNTKEGNWLFNTETVPPQRQWSSKLQQYLAFADHLGLDAAAPIEFGLGLDRAEEARVDALLGHRSDPFVVVFVGSTWESRWWFAEATADVLRTVRERHGLSAVIVGAAGAEQRFAAEIERLAGACALNLAGMTSLRDLIGVLARARAAFGPDSGPMHLAAAVGTPVVSLWGATSPERSAPHGCEDLAVVGSVACHPCYLRRCPIDRACMRQIRVEMVVGALEAALERRAA
jgi:lipopolysaccharide heptosyltransferase II